MHPLRHESGIDTRRNRRNSRALLLSLVWPSGLSSRRSRVRVPSLSPFFSIRHCLARMLFVIPATGWGVSRPSWLRQAGCVRGVFTTPLAVAGGFPQKPSPGVAQASALRVRVPSLSPFLSIRHCLARMPFVIPATGWGVSRPSWLCQAGCIRGVFTTPLANTSGFTAFSRAQRGLRRVRVPSLPRSPALRACSARVLSLPIFKGRVFLSRTSLRLQLLRLQLVRLMSCGHQVDELFGVRSAKHSEAVCVQVDSRTCA